MKKGKYKSEVIIVLSLLLVIIIIIFIFQYNSNTKINNINNNPHENIFSYPNEELSKNEIDALDLAINDEYKARATYKRVLEEHGNIKPFSNIINSESSHIAQLESIYKKYDLQIPDDNWYIKVPVFANIKDACEAGVNAEIENADLYDELLINVNNQDIKVIFEFLRDASRNNHLPAFQRCNGNK
ncbi:MAG: DUF2202 domain-containing protein [Candidatus Pacearchaeota archaeon]|jgi:hypothetical protein